MKTFKFRAYDKLENKMIENAQVLSNFTEMLKDERYVIMECTGKKDMKERDIYDADIIIIDFEYNNMLGYEMDSLLGAVAYDSNLAQFVVKWGNSITDFDYLKDKDIQVVCNFYELYKNSRIKL